MKFGFRFFISVVGFTAISAVTLAANLDMLSISGSARTRFEYTRNEGGSKAGAADTNALHNRFRFNLDVSPTSELKLRLTPEFTNVWGAGNAAGTTAYDPTFTAHEAWVGYIPNSTISIFVGRQALGLGNELVVGTNDWMNGPATTEVGVAGTRPYAYDVARLAWKHANGVAHFFAGKMNEGSFSATGGHEGYGLYTIWNVEKQIPFLKVVDFYMTYDNNRTAARARFVKAGVRAAGEKNVFDYNLEVNSDFGYRTRNLALGSKDLQKGVTVNSEVGAKFWTKHRASFGIDYANSETHILFTNFHKFLGATDFFVHHNILAFNLTGDLQILDKVKFKPAFFFFMRPNDKAAVLTLAGANGDAAKTDLPLGVEGDFELSYAAAKNLALDAGYLFMAPAGYFHKLQTIHKAYLQGTVVF